MEATALGAVAFIDKDKDIVALYAEMISILLCNDSLQLFKILVEIDFRTRLVLLCLVLVVMGTKLVNQRAYQPILSFIQSIEEVTARLGMMGFITTFHESTSKLQVEFLAVGDDHHTRIGKILLNIGCQRYHRKALARTLRVPDDTTFLSVHPFGSSFDGIYLMRAQHLLDAAIVQYAIMEEEHEVLLIEKHGVGFLFCNRITNFIGVSFPFAPECKRRTHCAVTKLHAIVGGDGELGGGKERRYEITLVAEMLLDAFLVVDKAALQLYHGKGNAVHINNNVRTLVLARQWVYIAHFFGDGKVIFLWMVKVEEHHILVVFLW